MNFVYFFVAQRSIVGTILEAQSHGALALGNACAFICPDKPRVDKVLGLSIVNCAQKLSNSSLPIEKQRNVTQYRRKSGQRRIEHREFFDCQQRREIYFSNENRLAKLVLT